MMFAINCYITGVLPLRPRPLRGVLSSTRRTGASFMSVQNLKPIGQFVHKLLMEP